VAKVTIFDPENKFVAHSGTFEEGVRDVWEAWGSVWVLSEGGKVSYEMTAILKPLLNVPSRTALPTLRATTRHVTVDSLLAQPVHPRHLAGAVSQAVSLGGR
jgi:hypothetical protein